MDPHAEIIQDKDGYYRVVLGAFGEATRHDAAHIVRQANGELVAYVASPEAREDADDWAEEPFRDAVHALVAGPGWDDGPYLIQYDPGTNQAEEEIIG